MFIFHQLTPSTLIYVLINANIYYYLFFLSFQFPHSFFCFRLANEIAWDMVIARNSIMSPQKKKPTKYWHFRTHTDPRTYFVVLAKNKNEKCGITRESLKHLLDSANAWVTANQPANRYVYDRRNSTLIRSVVETIGQYSRNSSSIPNSGEFYYSSTEWLDRYISYRFRIDCLFSFAA